MTAITFGTFNLNDNVNYFVLEKDDLSVPTLTETMFKIARLEGMQKTGETYDHKVMTLKVRILGTSRSDLENKVDTMLASLELRQQHLTIHTNDTRYYVADCIEKKIPLGLGQIISTIATLQFLCFRPFPIAVAQSSFTMSNQTLGLVSGSTYQTTIQNITGGGNIFARPTLVITSGASVAWTQVQLQQTTDSQYLTISSNLPTTSGDTLTIVCDPLAPNGYTAYKNAVTGTLCPLNGVFPVIEPTLHSWVITINAASAPQASCVWTWYPRWVS